MQKFSNAAKSIAFFLFAQCIINSAFANDETLNVGMTLYTPFSITENQGLTFADTTIGAKVKVTTTPADTSAAIFFATGEPNRTVIGSIVENRIFMTTGDGNRGRKRIRVNKFKTGGDMNATGIATFNNLGQLNNLRIGATAHVKANNIAGAYSGTATFRLLYN